MILHQLFFSFIVLSLILGTTICFPGAKMQSVGRAGVIPFLIVYLFMITNRVVFSDSLFYQRVFYSPEELIDNAFGAGFELYTLIFAKIGSWSLYIVLFPALLLLACLRLYTAFRNIINYRVAVFIILSWPFFWAYSATGYRQSLAIAVGVFAISALVKRRFILALIFLTLATQFHSSAALLLIAILAYRYRNTSKWFISIWLASIFVTAFIPIDETISSLLSLFTAGADYEHYFDGDFGAHYQTGLRPSFIILSAFPIIAFYFRRKSLATIEPNIMATFHTYLLINSIGNLCASVPYSDRIYAYSWLIAPVLIAGIWDEIPQILKCFIVACLIFLSATYSSYWLGI